jgi:Protein of unknown function (DUF4231)
MSTAISAVSAQSTTTDVTMQRLEDQIAWYSGKSRSAQRIYKRLKVVEILAAATIPFLAGLKFPNVALVTGGLGVLVTVIEGLIHLNQYQQSWTSYRATTEALKHEKYTYLANAGVYANAPDAHAMLAERVESLVSQEGAHWIQAQDKGNGSK